MPILRLINNDERQSKGSFVPCYRVSDRNAILFSLVGLTPVQRKGPVSLRKSAEGDVGSHRTLSGTKSMLLSPGKV